MMIIPIILIGAAVYIFYNGGMNNKFKEIGGSDNSLKILNERFARGEISEEEYNHKKDILINGR